VASVVVGTSILHYRIIRPIGSGGMGIVYEAEDTKLGRHVALKFLPPQLADDAAALERFQREARAASALNHPNICTIYAIEEANGARFIAMELLEGDSLDRRIGSTPLSWDALITTATQVADALAAAHARGIIHRDIKPANIFIANDGRARVLDFGIAKVTAHLGAQAETVGESRIQEALTGAGATIGTIAYMSPEQARGEDLDARTDIFSFGAVLYEMFTGCRAFEGKTTAVVFNKILEANPVRPQEINPSLPPKLEDIVLRALEKDPELRYQSAADVRSDLKRLQRDATTGRLAFVPPGPASVATPISSGAVLVAEARRHKGLAGAGVVTLLALTAAGAYGGYSWFSNREDQRPLAVRPSARAIPSRITSSGDVAGCASISPHGKYVVYCDFTGELKLRQVATGAVVDLGRYHGATAFSPDSDHVYVTVTSSENPSGVLLDIPSLGGDPVRIATHLSGAVGVSPDGQRLAFIRLDTARHESSIISADVRGGDQRTIATSSLDEMWFEEVGVSWSPNGKWLSANQATTIGGYHMRAVVVDVESGKVTALGSRKWGAVGRTVWLGNDTVLFSAREHATGTFQFWMVQYPGGEAVQLTNDTRGFDQQSVSVAADGTSLAAIQITTVGNIFSTNADATAPLEQWTSGARFDGGAPMGHMPGSGMALLPSGRLFYESSDGADMNIWSIDAPGRRPRLVTQGYAENPSTPRDGSFVAYQAIHDGRYRIWRANADGNEPRVLSHADDDIGPLVSPDGRWIYYWAPATFKVMRMASDSGDATVLSDLAVAPAALSADGRELLVRTMDTALKESHFLLDAETGAVKAKLDLGVDGVTFGRRPDLLTFLQNTDGVGNLWERPIAGGASRSLTKFTSGRIFGFTYSADRSRLFISRGQRSGDIVVLRDFR